MAVDVAGRTEGLDQGAMEGILRGTAADEGAVDVEEEEMAHGDRQGVPVMGSPDGDDTSTALERIQGRSPYRQRPRGIPARATSTR